MRLIKISAVLVLLAQALLGAGNVSQGAGPEIFLFNMPAEKGGSIILPRAKNITNNPGYDNQPSFSFDNRSILYASSRGRMATDIYEYFIATGKTIQITSTEEGEYSPRALDANTITFVREGKGQEMTVWKYDRRTKIETLALNIKEPIGYYAWNYKGDALVWVRYAFMVRWVNPEKGINEFVADYAQASIPQQIPGTSRFSFIERQANDELWIKEFDPITRAIRPIIQSKDGKKDYCWMMDSSLLIGSGSELFTFNERSDKGWKLAADLESEGIKDISRMAVSFDSRHLAIVSNQ